jgi:trehalose utilization protein
MTVTIWNEFRHEREDEAAKEIYPEGIHEVLAEHFRAEGDMQVRTATLDQTEHGLPAAVLAETDVLLWWGHRAHAEVSDKVAARVQQAVQQGMGFLALHSAHFSKPFKLLMGTTCGLSWREDGGRERLWVTDPTHPIAAGVERYMEIPRTEMYGEYFDVPSPDELVFISWFSGGEVFRSGMLWKRGRGRIFYFRPGHETYPIYHQGEVLQVISNAVRYLAPRDTARVNGIGAATKVTAPEE